MCVGAQRYEQLEKAKVEQDLLLVEMRTQLRDLEAGQFNFNDPFGCVPLVWLTLPMFPMVLFRSRCCHGDAGDPPHEGRAQAAQ